MKTLVVYYSKTGGTEWVAKRVAERLGAETERIGDRSHRAGLLGFLRSGFESFRKRTPDIDPPRETPSSYEVVIVGTPIWAGRMASPVRSYLQRVSGTLPAMALFYTSGGGGYDETLDEMARMAGAKAVARTGFRQKDLRTPEGERQVDAFSASVESIARRGD